LEELRRNGRVELHLDLTPPSLGRVRVQLVTRDTAVNVRIIVHDETARQAVTGQLDALRLRLGEAGVSVGRFNVQRDGQHAGHRYEPQHDRGDSEAAVVRTRNPRGTATPGAQVLSDSTVDVIA
jgi:flagellar hook-length control protein FliK